MLVKTRESGEQADVLPPIWRFALSFAGEKYLPLDDLGWLAEIPRSSVDGC